MEVTCKGSVALNTACYACKRCRAELVERFRQNTDHAFFDREGVKWWKWNGDNCPVANGVRVQVARRDTGVDSEVSTGHTLRWTNADYWHDIVAYRIVEE